MSSPAPVPAQIVDETDALPTPPTTAEDTAEDAAVDQEAEPQPAESAPSDEEDEASDDSDDSDSDSDDSNSASSSDASSSLSSIPEMTLEALEGLWRKARDIAAAAEKEASSHDAIDEQEDVIQLDTEPGAEEFKKQYVIILFPPSFPSLSLPQPSYSTPTFLTVFTSRLSFRPKDHTLGVRL